jgi:hypothetical protein
MVWDVAKATEVLGMATDVLVIEALVRASAGVAVK